MQDEKCNQYDFHNRKKRPPVDKFTSKLSEYKYRDIEATRDQKRMIVKADVIHSWRKRFTVNKILFVK